MASEGLVPRYAEAIMASSLPKKEELARLVRPAIYLHTHPTEKGTLEVGTSRLGGIPDLPEGIDWPMWNGVPQAFIAQINLSELPDCTERHLLPEEGYLFFFYDSLQSTYGNYASDRGSFAVLFGEHAGARARQPEKHPEAVAFRAARLTFLLGMSEPGWEHPMLEELGLSFDEQLKYGEVVHAEEKKYANLEVLSSHQMLGYPHPMQYTPAWECARAQEDYLDSPTQSKSDIARLVENWELLLQLDHDSHADIEWAGDGILYFMIQRDDLKNRRFGRAWISLQTT